eukprot:COSAG01_NODE_1641_length_9647_cov_5.299539_9_plen_81_part_00
MGLKTAGVRWENATTATQQLAVCTHLLAAREGEDAATVRQRAGALVGGALHQPFHDQQLDQWLSFPFASVHFIFGSYHER